MFQHEQISEKEHLQELLGPRVLIKHGYLEKKNVLMGSGMDNSSNYI